MKRRPKTAGATRGLGCHLRGHKRTGEKKQPRKPDRLSRKRPCGLARKKAPNTEKGKHKREELVGGGG